MEPTYFCLELPEKLTDFNAVFTVRINDERYMWRYAFHPSHLINAATLPCENRNSKSVILQWDITKENYIKRILYACTEERYVTSVTCKNAWRKLELTLNRTLSRLRLTSGATVWDHVCVLVADTLKTCCEIVYLYYVVHQNILWNYQCNLVHLKAIL